MNRIPGRGLILKKEGLLGNVYCKPFDKFPAISTKKTSPLSSRLEIEA